MRRISASQVLVWACMAVAVCCLSSCVTSGPSVTPGPAPLVLEGVLEDGLKPSSLRFSVRAPWMKAPLVMHLPQQVFAAGEQLFIEGAFPAASAASSAKEFSGWRRDARTGALSYRLHLSNGVEWTATALPGPDSVFMKVHLKNGSSEPLRNLSMGMLVATGASGDFPVDASYGEVGSWFDGAFDFLGGRIGLPDRAYATVRVRGAMLPRTPPGALPGGGWYLEQVAEVPLVGCVSRDRSHLLAMSWFNACQQVTVNARHSTLQAGPDTSVFLEPGAEYIWRGKLYLAPNAPTELLRRFREDQRRIRCGEYTGTIVTAGR